jgi:hypothetical protein
MSWIVLVCALLVIIFIASCIICLKRQGYDKLLN